MDIELQRLFVCEPSTPESLEHFVGFWARQYEYPNPEIYTRNIRGPHTAKSLRELFAWKIGKRLSGKQLPRVATQFIDRHEEAAALSKELASCEPDAAKAFLDRFKEGGPVYRIFWLHCWNPRFPIYDQHVYRTMTYVVDGKPQELNKIFGDQKKIDAYLERYLSFFAGFCGIDPREVDKALWQFGKSLKEAQRREQRRNAASGSTQ